MFFRRTEVEIVDSIPAGILKRVRRWDLAATEPHDGNWDPDWTCGVKMARVNSGQWFVENVEFARKRADAVRKLILDTARLDGKFVDIGLPQDPGQAGVDQAQSFVTWLAGYTVWTERETGDKLTRAEPFATQWQGHNVVLLRAPWNQRYLDLMEAFPTPGIHDDVVDASSGAFKHLIEEKDIFRQFSTRWTADGLPPTYEAPPRGRNPAYEAAAEQDRPPPRRPTVRNHGNLPRRRERQNRGNAAPVMILFAADKAVRQRGS